MSFWKVIAACSVLGLGTIWHQSTKVRHSDRLNQQVTLSSLNFSDEPQQSNTTEPSFEFNGFSVKPLAVFLVRARILSKANYSYDFESKLSPIDLALGWNRMAEPSIYEPLRITQSGRWYRYSWSNGPPIPAREIIESSANMHMIPANPSVGRVLESAEAGKFIKIYGLLVEATNDSGWKWRSSLSRSDSGMSSCELVFVLAAEIE